MEDLFNVILGRILYSPGGATVCIVSIIARLSGFLRHIPFLGSTIKNNTIKNGVIFSLAIMIFIKSFTPQEIQSMRSIANLMLIFIAIKEFAIGYIIGYILGMPFYIAQTAGAFIDVAKGSSSLTPGAGLMQTQASMTGVIFVNVLIVHTLLYPEIFIDFMGVIFNSFDAIPYNKINILLELSYIQITDVVHGFSLALLWSARLSAPIMTLSLCSDLSLSLINRLMPQAQITFLSVPIKSLVSLLIIMIAWSRFFNEMHKATFLFIDYCNGVLFNGIMSITQQ